MNNNFQTRQQSLRHFRHSLGNQLRQIRTNCKLNIAEAAKLLGRSQEYLIALESGNFANVFPPLCRLQIPIQNKR